MKGTSPAIDKGDDSLNILPTDLGGDPRKQAASIDMGAYEAPLTPDISVHKTSDHPTAKVGDTVTYAYEVINTGGVDVTDLTAGDDLLGTITLSTDTLAPGESVTATLSYTVSAEDPPGPIANTATATGTIGVATTVVASDTASVSLSYRPQLALDVTASSASAQPGDVVTYT